MLLPRPQDHEAAVSVGACCTCGWQRPCRTAAATWVSCIVRHHAKEDQQPQTKHMTSLQAKLLPVRAFPSYLLVEPQHGHVPVAVAARCTSSCPSERRWQRGLLASRDATQMRMSNRNQASALSRLEGKHSCVASSCMCVRRYSICRAADRRAPVSVSVGACCTCGWQRPCRAAMAMYVDSSYCATPRKKRTRNRKQNA